MTFLTFPNRNSSKYRQTQITRREAKKRELLFFIVGITYAEDDDLPQPIPAYCGIHYCVFLGNGKAPIFSDNVMQAETYTLLCVAENRAKMLNKLYPKCKFWVSSREPITVQTNLFEL